MPLVHHPVFTSDVRDVPADKVDEHVAAGWLRHDDNDSTTTTDTAPVAAPAQP